ncbi:thiamine-phosphate kinase [Roseospira marina]|uniref:Thiamine-monophosphate kinase n=1 Tax=Roseospira marina TaxID=140057 RepID=A0A5M6I7F9_9PROT|nr:thiamine-phosphate kinase [Roseospira marina]KAA5604136.1 thiamine-phosphate kinase [Roseospira marina]MBB4315768.1 thiamine-monophosphate kinase [Roseospira marina]MBB5088935.1 thiamine-monophosphate kinase [Roseospira marina]
MARRGEFDLITTLFAPLARRCPAALGLADDAAVLPPFPEGQATVISADMLVAGVHFLPEDPPDRVAMKALRVNLSDMAAMGATPVGVVLTLALSPAEDDRWLDGFAAGLGADLEAWTIGLLGGDTVSTPGPVTISVTILGSAPPGAPLTRGGARAGDDLWVSGTIGDAALGLKVLTGAVAPADSTHRDALIARYHVPCPRVRLGVGLRGLATAALDVSDGLVGDLGHLCTASGLGARVETGRVPLSPAARACVDADPGLVSAVLGGGDDYELLFAAPPDRADAVQAAARAADVPVACIGRLEPGAEIALIDAQGQPVLLDTPGWRHHW